ncbi:MAG: type II secretion system F family protein [Planctomycetota bacterium]
MLGLSDEQWTQIDPYLPMAVAALAALALGLAAWSLLSSTANAKPALAGQSYGDAMRRRRRLAAAERSAAFRMALPAVETGGRWLGGGRVPGANGLAAMVSWHYRSAGQPGGLNGYELAALSLLVSLGVMLMTATSVALASIELGFRPELWATVLFMGVVGPLSVMTYLKGQVQLRERAFLRDFPYAIDLLVLVLRAGSSLVSAMRQVSDDHRDAPVGEEFGEALAQIELGTPTREAFAALSGRMPTEEVETFVDTVLQSEELGWPLAEALERFSDRLVVARQQRAQEIAGSAAVMVMVPSTLILIAVMLLLMGPVALRFVTGQYDLG